MARARLFQTTGRDRGVGLAVLVIALITPMAGRTAQRPSVVTTGSGLIAGQVLDVTSRLPIAGATVSMSVAAPTPATPPLTSAAARAVAASSRPAPRQVLADSQGRFAFASLAPGTYTLRMQHPGYAPVRGATVDLARDDRVTDVVLRAGRLGVISGTVRDDAGDPIVGTSVRTFLRTSIGFRRIWFPRSAAVTDDRGHYRVGDLPAGDYLVCACGREPLPIDKDMLDRLASFPVSAARVAQVLSSEVLTFAPTFHPGNTRVLDATLVRVAHGDDRLGIDITMLAATPRRVTGRLTGGPQGAGSAQALLLFPEGDDPTALGIAETAPVSVTPDGVFVFVGITPGRYTLMAFPSEGKSGLWASMPLVVGNEDVSDIVVPLGAGVTVSGRLEFSGAAARPDTDTLEKARVGLLATNLTLATLLNAGTSGAVGHSAMVQRDGSFAVQGLPPGRYIVSASGLGQSWQTVESIRTGDGLSLEPTVNVTSFDVETLVVTMSDMALATLEGTVALQKYESPGEMRVMIFPVDRATWADTFLAPSRFTWVFVSAARTFRLNAIPPGDYHVVLIAPDEFLMSPERLAEWATRSQTVRLGSGETRMVTVKR